MKWIKLFESFNNLEKKIEFANNIYFYKRFFLDLIETDIEQIETKKYIYFYIKFIESPRRDQPSYWSSAMGELYFVYHISTNTLLFPSWRLGGYNLLRYDYKPIEKVYEKALGDFFEKYKNLKVNLSSTHVNDWMKYERNFARLKES